MTRIVDTTNSEVSGEIIALSVASVSAGVSSGHVARNDPNIDMDQKRLRADSHQSQLSESSWETGKDVTFPRKALRPALKTIKSEHELSSGAAASNFKPRIISYKEDIEAQRSISSSSRQSGAQSTRLQRFRFHWLTAYRVLIAVTFIMNATILGLLIGLDLPITSVLVATSTNLFVSVLVRQEDLINLSFELVARIPSTTPLAIRKVIADFHHYGGVHIGCAVSALLWYCVFIYANTRTCILASRYGWMTSWHWADIITCYFFLLFITSMCLTAIPRIRERLHNQFERIHRFGGWLSLITLWINAGIHTIIDPSDTPLYKSASIWLLLLATLLLILPWLRIRRVKIHAESLSTREIKLTIPYTNLPYTSTVRFSLSPLIEWHAFATIPSSDSSTASIIISAAGDWTKRIVANPPLNIWIRSPPASNFLSFAPLFKSLLLVTTGAGIGPMLSLLASPSIRRMKDEGRRIRVMWCVYDPLAPHWDFVHEMIGKVDPEPRIFNSRAGRPNLAFEARYLAQQDGLEAVMIVSNRTVTERIVREVKRFGGAAYGAIFDS